MKFKLVENFDSLNEDTLTNVNADIIRRLTALGVTVNYVDNDRKFILCVTPLGNNFCIPIKEQSRTNSSDYKKLRYPLSNGVIVNGEIYDVSRTTHFGRAYYGLPTNHQHLDYNPHVYEYTRNDYYNGTPIDFNTFLNDVKNGKY